MTTELDGVDALSLSARAITHNFKSVTVNTSLVLITEVHFKEPISALLPPGPFLSIFDIDFYKKK